MIKRIQLSIVMNSHYQVVNTYQAGDGYSADLHDLQILPNGNALLMVYDAETVDMSKIVAGRKNKRDGDRLGDSGT